MLTYEKGTEKWGATFDGVPNGIRTHDNAATERRVTATP